MKILGLSSGELNSSASLSVAGKIVCGAPEERFIRQKFTKNFPVNAIKYCLKHAGIELPELDAIAQAWNPGAAWASFNPLYSGQRIEREDTLYSLVDNLYHLTDRKPGDYVEMTQPKGSNMPPLYFVQHHRAHAANAFFLSEFEDAAILTCDFRGELECTTMAEGKGKDITAISSQVLPHSLGMFYATYTQLLGYKPDSDEWKVMAMSAWQGDCAAHLDKIRTTYKLCDDGTLELDSTYYVGLFHHFPKMYSPKLVGLLGGREGSRGDEPDDWDMSVAKAMQLASEEIAFHFINHLAKKSKSQNLVVGGGYFMNSVLNGKILERSPFKNLYVSYAPSDAGNSMGAALYVAHCVKREERKQGFNSSLIGPCYNDRDIETSLVRRGIPFTKLKDTEGRVAELIADGKIVALFNGRMEFGDRALGARSILADPRDPKMKDRINAMVKYREGYRPFAPATLVERVTEFFDVPEGFECPYMEKVVKIRPEFRKKIPSVTHLDGSGRVQTVRKDENLLYYEIISKFGEITGIPIIINTSFNVNGEPIVLTPDDAISTFFNSGLDCLVIGNHLVVKQGSAAA